jgi:putative transposase
MPRHPRAAPGGYVYHALNRGVARLTLFEKEADYAAFERVLAEALAEHPTRVLGYCPMPNHCHFLLWPTAAGELTAFLRWLTHTHTQRWHAHYHTAGTGHLYQGRYRACPVEEDEHLVTVLRYVERNPLRAGLVGRAEAWRWSSLGRRQASAEAGRPLLQPWPLPVPADWLERIHRPETEAALEAVRRSVVRGRPFGSAAWAQQTTARLGLEYTLRPRGRPRKQAPEEGAADPRD